MSHLTVDTEFPVQAEEIWEDVPGQGGVYQVSNLGRVRSFANGRYGKRLVPKLRKTVRNRDGYRVVQLGHKSRLLYVHRLVLETFVGPCPPGMECLHGPNGRGDNSLANLSWGTRSQNQGEDQVRDGTDNRGEKHPMHRLTEADVIDIRQQLRSGAIQAEIARAVRIHPSVVSRINSGKLWGWLAG